MKIVVVGGSGLIGSKLLTKLGEHGHEALDASPRSGVDSLTGEGLPDVLDGADVVVDVSNSPSSEEAAVMTFFTTSTRNILAAEMAAGVSHHVALSVVGVDRLLESGYSRAKIAQRKLIEESPTPYSIVYATQFFEFIKNIADAATKGDTVRLAPVLVQPIAADDVASAVRRVAVGSPVNGLVEVAGPDQFRLDELIRDSLRALNDPRNVITDARAPYFGAQLNERTLIPDGRAFLGTNRFEDWQSSSAAASLGGGLTVSSKESDLRREVADELKLAESSHCEEVIREPIGEWLFDPAEYRPTWRYSAAFSARPRLAATRLAAHSQGTVACPNSDPAVL